MRNWGKAFLPFSFPYIMINYFISRTHIIHYLCTQQNTRLHPNLSAWTRGENWIFSYFLKNSYWFYFFAFVCCRCLWNMFFFVLKKGNVAGRFVEQSVLQQLSFAKLGLVNWVLALSSSFPYSPFIGPTLSWPNF